MSAEAKGEDLYVFDEEELQRLREANPWRAR